MIQKNNPPATSIASETGSAEPELNGRQKFRLVSRAILNRVRFVAVLVAVALFIGYWDTVKNHWDRWTHPRARPSANCPRARSSIARWTRKWFARRYEPNGDVPNCPICGMPL